jgi:hypothetical protein
MTPEMSLLAAFQKKSLKIPKAISGVRSEIILHNTVLVTNGKIMMI